jgi:hypothetical protein
MINYLCTYKPLLKMLDAVKQHVDWVVGACYGTIVWANNSSAYDTVSETPRLVFQTVLVTFAAFLAKKLIEWAYNGTREIIKDKVKSWKDRKKK